MAKYDHIKCIQCCICLIKYEFPVLWIYYGYCISVDNKATRFFSRFLHSVHLGLVFFHSFSLPRLNAERARATNHHNPKKRYTLTHTMSEKSERNSLCMNGSISRAFAAVFHCKFVKQKSAATKLHLSTL